MFDIVFHIIPMQVIPNVGPQQPQGFGGISTLIAYVEWFVIIACFIGFLLAGGKIGLAVHSGNGTFDGLKGAILAVIGCIMVGGAATIFKVLT